MRMKHGKAEATGDWGVVRQNAKGTEHLECLNLVKRLVPLLKHSSSSLSFSWQVQEEHQSLVYCASNHVHQDPSDSLQASDQVGSTMGGSPNPHSAGE